MKEILTVAGVFTGAALIVATACAWVTHVIWIINALASDHGATAGQIVLGLIGIFMPPIGAIHGFIIWCS